MSQSLYTRDEALEALREALDRSDATSSKTFACFQVELDHLDDLKLLNRGSTLERDILRLQRAIAFAESVSPLPRCSHGNALRDGAREKLEPTCGCRAED